MPRLCSYCGLENSADAPVCVQCGTELPKVENEALSAGADATIAPPILVAEPPPRLNGGFATLVFIANVGAQIAASFVFGIIAFAIGAVDPRALRGAGNADEDAQRLFMFVALPSVLAGGAAVFALCLGRIRSQLTDVSPTGAAWVVGSRKQIFSGFGVGIILAFAYAVLSILFPPDQSMEMGPIARMGMTPGPQQIIWLTIALLFAPLIEECLFRGVMYGGYRRSFGPVWAAILSLLLFWVLHLAETFGYWPAMLGIFALAAVALRYRLKCSAIGPAIAVHLGYNFVIALGATLSSYATP
jgi:membrane protease YdiL (CAAX protease family)